MTRHVLTILFLLPALSTRADSPPAAGIQQLNVEEAVHKHVLDNLNIEDWPDIVEDDIDSFHTSASFGDLTGDGVEEAAVFVSYFVGGTAASKRARVFVYRDKDGTLHLMEIMEGGDRASGGISGAQIEDGHLHIDTHVPDADGCLNCYGGVERRSYAYKAGNRIQMDYQYVGDLVIEDDPETGYRRWVLKEGEEKNRPGRSGMD